MAMVHELYRRGVFFLADSPRLSYVAQTLADGLHQLGVPVFSSVEVDNPLISGFRIPASPVADAADAGCCIVDLERTAGFDGRRITIHSPCERTVALCMQDNVHTFAVQGPALLLAVHENRFLTLEGTRVPIGFGLSSAMIESSLRLVDGRPREELFLHSFRPSHAQDLRAAMDLCFVPLLTSRLPVRRASVGSGRWSREFWELLSRSFGCLAYGGAFLQDLRRNDYFRDRIDPTLMRFHTETVVVRWDSWRFWESLCFGCLTIHLDFETYGFTLPQMPVNWRHYVGIDLSAISRDVERIMDERDRLPDIAAEGRRWAIEHYSPVAVARRFVSLAERLWGKEASDVLG